MTSKSTNLLFFFILLVPLSINFAESSQDCGFVSNNSKLSSANWPWLVSLFYYYNGQYFCTGTLITDKHVLSAAHCLSGTNFSTPHQQVFVILGRTNFSQISPFEQIKNVTSIKIHPNWKKTDGNYDSDIAVLTLAGSITFTELVQPICLPTAEYPDSILTGTIAGFKKSQNEKSVDFFESSVQNITSCLLGDEKSCEIYSEQFFCNSISGSGFYGRKNESLPFKIYGLFSKGMEKSDEDFCGLNNFVVFTFVRPYVDWIVEVINEPFLGEKRTGKELKEPAEIFCDYKWNYEQSDPVYTCVIRGLVIPSPYTSISDTLLGLHGEDDTDLDVNRIHITKSTTIFLPDTKVFAKKFQNVKNFWVSKSNLKFVERSKLKAMENLTILCFNENKIEELPADAFLDLSNLEILWIYSNQIKELNEKLLMNLKKLRIFDARNNLIEKLPGRLFANNPDLKVVNLSFNSLKKIDVDFAEFKSLKWIVLDGNECAKISYCKILDCLKSVQQFQDVLDKNC